MASLSPFTAWCVFYESILFEVDALNLSLLQIGSRVRMTPARLRKECLSDPENTVLSMRFVDDKLVGHAFATRWTHENRRFPRKLSPIKLALIRKLEYRNNLLDNAACR